MRTFSEEYESVYVTEKGVLELCVNITVRYWNLFTETMRSTLYTLNP